MVVAVIQIIGTNFAAHRVGVPLPWTALVLLLAGPVLLLLRR